MLSTTHLLRLAFSLSQNHRMVGVGRDLCGSSSPTLLPKQGDFFKVGFLLGFFFFWSKVEKDHKSLSGERPLWAF